MNRILIKATILAPLLFSYGQQEVVAFDGAKFGMHLKEMRSNLPEESQKKFDRLWQDIAVQKKQKKFSKVNDAFDELMQLIPESVQTWKYAAWSLGYFWFDQEVSTKENYRAIRQAILLLMDGVRANPDNPILLYELGWYTGQKIGFHEHKSDMRALFRKDKQLHKAFRNLPYLKKGFGVGRASDNWLVAKLLYEQAIMAYDVKGQSIGEKYPPTFCSSLPLMLSGYADSLADEGHFSPETTKAWQDAAGAWEELASRPFKSEQYGLTFRLKDKQDLEKIIMAGGEIQDSIKARYRLAKTGRLITNIDAWQQLCRIEQTDLVLKARRTLHRAINQLKSDRQKGDGPVSISTRMLFDASFQHWADVYEKHDGLIANGLILEDFSEAIDIYRAEILGGRELPVEFPLASVIQHWEKESEPLEK